MAIEPFPLLKRLQVGSYDNCVILTYTADLYFFEEVVWPTLVSRGCCNNFVIMDSRQYMSALDTTGPLLRRLGKSYSVWPVPAAKAFHPKLVLQTTEKTGRLIIGSGNLTVRGFSTNWELFSEVASAHDSGTAGIFADAWKLITESAQVATRAVRWQLEQMRGTSGALLSPDAGENWPRLLFSAPDQPSLLKQLKSLIGKATVRRLIIVAPFFDPTLQAVREFEKVFGVRDIIAVVQQKSVSFPGDAAKAAKALAVHEFVPPHDGKSGYLHAKAYVIQTSTTEYCVWGSPNCSMAALAGQGNYEAVLVTKGKVGDGVATLGLGASIKKGQKINPGKLNLATTTSPAADPSLYAISAEVDRGEICVVIAPIARFSECADGRLKLWSKGIPIDDLEVKRVDDVTFAGKLNRSKGDGSVICRLILQDETRQQESTAVAVHFLKDLEEATPTRLQARMHRVVAAIHSGTFDWAKGLESVCELVIKIGLHEDANRSRGRDGLSRVNKQDQPAGPGGEAKEGVYEDFVSDAEYENGEAKKVQSHNLLGDVVATLRAQILRGVTNEDDGENEADDHAAWRYREEAERDAAESGASEARHDLPDPEALKKDHSRVRRAYGRLMRGLTRRYEWLRDHEQAIGTEEFWRLDAVTLLLSDGCGRFLAQVRDLGPVLLPEDIMHSYLPAVAVFLGRVRVLRSSNYGRGPLLDSAQVDQSDAGITDALRSTCALLTGAVAHWRHAMRPGLDDDSVAEWPHYAEIVAARCLAAILRRKLLPTEEEICEVASHSAWLASIGCNTIVDIFKDLCRLARSIVRCEDQFAVKRLPYSFQEFRPGDWVCSASSGVTEVVRVSGSQVEIAMIGQPDTAEEWFLEVKSNCLRRANIPTKMRIGSASVAEELNHLLPYTDQDFEDWRDIIMPQLKRGYLISLLEVSKRARSSQLRSEASKQLERNARAYSPPTPDPKVAMPGTKQQE